MRSAMATTMAFVKAVARVPSVMLSEVVKVMILLFVEHGAVSREVRSCYMTKK